ncbi:FAD-dependent pyridine nucleotide-disulfide oxidoreductase [Planctomycetales bacterium 10988]|nr:FAD-dependent pyridine nucleotide-disulfide oxidoreductase [Planctomycetales bacterium 10988]
MNADAAIPLPKNPKVIVIGGGFAGLNCAKSLKKKPVQVQIFDKTNYHLFQPLLYQVASAALSPADIARPIRQVFRDTPNIDVLMAEITSIDVENKRVFYDGGSSEYDYLVVAAGAVYSYFGHDNWEKHAPGLKTLDDALEIRRRVLLAFEEAEQEEDPEARERQLTFVIVGGGPTGVEMAGAIKEIAVNSIPSDFRRIDTKHARVILIEAADCLLPPMPEKLRNQAKKDLEKIGVEVHLGEMVSDIDAEGVTLKSGKRILARNVVWAAGVKGVPLAESLGRELARGGRVEVESDLTLPGHPEVFIVGDLALAKDAKTGKVIPGLAPAAIQMGKYVADVIEKEAKAGQISERKGFHYVDRGAMATIGRHRAVADVKGWEVTGYLAWWMWGVIHIFFLIGFRNKLFVVMSWLWSNLLFAKGARLITGFPRIEVKKRIGKPKEETTPTEEPASEKVSSGANQ